jgi:hypothetical protein
MDSWWPAGDGSTLSLDFTTGTLDPLLTFTRSSSGTYLGSDGLVKTAGSNVARFEYDTSGNPLGLLIEGSTTNLLAHTERLDEAQVSTEQYWITTYSVTGVTAATTGPDAVSNSATQFAPLAGNGTCIASAAMGTSAQRSFSFWAKRSSGTTNLEYTLDNGTTWVAVTTTSSWQRFKIAATTAAQRVGFRFATNNVYEIWGCQLEAGLGSSSYVKNVSAAGGASRATDSCTIGVDPGTALNFSSWWPLNQSSWTVLWTGDIVRATTTVQFLWLTRTSGGASLMRVFANSTSGQPLIGFPGNSISPASTVNATPGAFLRTVLANQEGDQAFYANNGTVSSSGTGSNTSVSTLSANMNFNPNFDQFMHIKALKFWPTRLPNATLQGLVS